jgi:hypothetical protein
MRGGWGGHLNLRGFPSTLEISAGPAGEPEGGAPPFPESLNLVRVGGIMVGVSREDDASVATRLVSGAVGFNLSQLCVGAGVLDLSLDDLGGGEGGRVSLEGIVVFGSGTNAELRCEPYTIAALQRLQP